MRGYGYDMRSRDYGDMNYGATRGDMRSMDYRGGDYRGGQMMGDGHHYPQAQGGSTYYPIQAMGTFEGYYGMPEQDYRRGRDYGYDMRGRDYRRDYGYRDYGYDDYGDYGETLSDEEIEKWAHKLMSQLDEREKQMFHKDAIMQKIKSMGLKMEGFSEKELYVNTLANYTDHKKSIGQNPDLAIRLAYEDFCDEDSEYRGSEWLAVYYDTFVEPNDD
jgi:hypothetical protein